MASSGLSDKAKGKQRVRDLAYDSSSPASVTPRTLVVRFSEGIPDLTLDVEQRDTVRDIKRQIRDYRPQLKENRLRLIHSGRILTDDTLLYSWLDSLEERQRRVVSKVAEGSSDASQSSTWIHCAIGPKMEPGEEDETKVQQTQLKPLRGFDRLAAAGFSASDIANFRTQFHSQSSSNFLDQDFASEEDYDEHARALEEQWMDSMNSVGPGSLGQGSSQTSGVILNGIMLGFFFPIIPFFFFREHKRAVFWEDGPEHDVSEPSPLSKRMQMGIVIGFVMNLVFGIWTYALS
ncbi:DUF2407 ubiquitin-like domain-containing protein [Irpex rosettiformis]|uniref:DUF2407 ubiquitin-like domain-containing protein n=1 Tax=Irpex rosettiformis TaxID=378272 RepID=A0ACB8TYT6_9APHY|nr:DUF2407 ubiquitin-like domain-containing protein [Irpex rosettiformis]